MAILSFPLLVCATLLVLFSDSQRLFLLVALAGSGCGLYGLFLLLTRPRLVRFTNVLSVSLLLGYALGTVIYAFSSLLSSPELDLTYNAFGLDYRRSDLSMALLLVYMTSTVLFFLSRVESPVFGATPMRQAFASPRARLLIWLGAGIVLRAFLVGDLGYMGTQVDESSSVPALGSLAFLMIPVLLPMTALCILEETSRWRRALLLLVLGLFLLALLPLGRRVLLYSLVILLMTLALSGRWLPRYSMVKWIGIAFIGLGLICIIAYLGFQFFYALRLAVESQGLEVGIGELLRATFEILQHESSEVSSELASNMVERPFILSYLAAFVAAQSTYPPLWGEELVYALKIAIPSLLFLQKTALLPSAPEEFVHPAFGFYIFDGPNTIVTAGFNDFGLVGMVLYPILLVAIYIAIRRILRGRIPLFIYYFVMLRLIYQLFSIEQSLAGLLTTALRDLALTTLVCVVIWYLPIFNSSTLAKRIR